MHKQAIKCNNKERKNNKEAGSSKFIHHILRAQAGWVPDCYHLFHLTATKFIETPFWLLLLLLEHVYKEQCIDKVKFLDIQVIQCRNNPHKHFYESHNPCWGWVFCWLVDCSLVLFFLPPSDSHLISIKQFQFQIQKPPAPQLRTPVYTWNTHPGFLRDFYLESN